MRFPPANQIKNPVGLKEIPGRRDNISPYFRKMSILPDESKRTKKYCSLKSIRKQFFAETFRRQIAYEYKNQSCGWSTAPTVRP